MYNKAIMNDLEIYKKLKQFMLKIE